MAFNSIYYFNKKKFFSWDNLIIFFMLFSIILFVGLPFILIRILFLFFKYFNFWKIWDAMSPYTNIKLVFVDRSIIRNMKKITPDFHKKVGEILTKSDKIKMGVLKTEKGKHAISINQEDGIGVTLTSKIQKNCKGMEVITFANNKKTIAYAQAFTDNNKIIEYDQMSNLELKKVLDGSGKMAAIGASKKLVETANKWIVLNTENKQKLIEITEKQRSFSKAFLEKCGGIEKISNILVSHKILSEVKINAEKMFFLLANCEPKKREHVFIKYKDTYEQLIFFEKDKQIWSNEPFLNLLKKKIDLLLNFDN